MDKLCAGVIVGFLMGLYLANRFYHSEGKQRIKTRYYGKDWIREREFIEQIVINQRERKGDNN
jgi:hypothetical protein